MADIVGLHDLTEDAARLLPSPHEFTDASATLRLQTYVNVNQWTEW